MSWEILKAANAQLEQEPRKRTSMWADSDFRWLKTLSLTERGKAGARLVALLLRELGYTTTDASLAQTIEANGCALKVKTSMLWSTNQFRFQQIEHDAYTHLALLGLAPHAAWFWLCPREVAFEHAEAQHGELSRWLSIRTAATSRQPQLRVRACSDAPGSLRQSLQTNAPAMRVGGLGAPPV
jgi:hypothetical protein